MVLGDLMSIISSVPPSVANITLTIFMVSLFISQLESKNITNLINLGFIILIPFVSLPLRYTIKHHRDFQCSGQDDSCVEIIIFLHFPRPVLPL